MVDISHNDTAIKRLIDEVLLEQDEHWRHRARKTFSAERMAAIQALGKQPTQPSLQEAEAAALALSHDQYTSPR